MSREGKSGSGFYPIKESVSESQLSGSSRKTSLLTSSHAQLGSDRMMLDPHMASAAAFQMPETRTRFSIKTSPIGEDHPQDHPQGVNFGRRQTLPNQAFLEHFSAPNESPALVQGRLRTLSLASQSYSQARSPDRLPLLPMPNPEFTPIETPTPSMLAKSEKKGSGSLPPRMPFQNDIHAEFDGLDYVALAEFFEQGTAPVSHGHRVLAPHRNIRFMFYSEKTSAIRSPNVDKIDLSGYGCSVSDLLKSGAFWLDVCNPTDLELQQISRAFGIHPLTKEDIQTPDTREKCELFSSYYFVVIRSFEQDQMAANFLFPVSIFLVVFRDCVVSFQYTATPHAGNVLFRIDQLRQYGLHVTPDWINYALLDDIMDSFVPILRFIELEVDSIDDMVLILKENEQTDMLRRIGKVRKQVMTMLRLLSAKADLVKSVITRVLERTNPDSDTRYYLEDIHDHVITMNQNAIHYEKTLGRTHSNYLAQISIEITQASNRTSDVVMKMTALASILVPLNVVTGIWGMNVKVPGQNGDSLDWFFCIITGMLLIAVVCYYVVRRAKLV